MNCKIIADENLLYEYADGTLAEDRAEALETHLETCPACRGEEIRLRSLMAEISGLALDLAPTQEPESARILDVSQADSQPGEDRGQRREITDRYISALRIALAIRDFPAAQKLIDYHLVTLMTLDPDQRNAARLVGLFGRWMDMGYSHVGGGKTSLEPSRLEMLNSRLRLFPRPPRPLLSMENIFYLRMASGYAALAEQRNEDALADFSFAVAAFPETGDRELGALAHFGVAKVHRRRGEYDKAEPYVCEAIRLAEEAGRAEMAAGFSVLRGWLLFQGRNVNAAKEVLFNAGAVLRRTEDHLRLGNIQSALGRIAQREGRFHDALRYYDIALLEYKKCSPQHGNNGRALVNRAFVNRLLAVRTLKKGSGSESESEEAGRLWQKARADLKDALDIYDNLNHGRGLASVKVVSALLYLDSEDFDEAEREAEEAYQLGTEKMDMIVAARARIVQCITENARALNETRRSSEAAACLERALTCAEEAMELARKTQNRRLQARAYIWRGLTLLRANIDNYGEASVCCDRGKSLLEPRGGSYAAEELASLERELGASQGPRQVAVMSGHKRSKVVPEESTANLFESARGRGK